MINRALEGQSEHADKAELVAALRNVLPSDVMMYGISIEAIAATVRRALNRDESEA